MKWFLVGALSLAILVVITMALRPPKIEVVATVVDGQLHFKITHNDRVNNLVGIFLWTEEAENYLWVVEGHNLGAVSYGELPPKGKQLVPKDGTPPATISASDIIFVQVQYQYDDLPFTASLGSVVYEMTFDPGNKVQQLGKPNKLEYPRQSLAPE